MLALLFGAAWLAPQAHAACTNTSFNLSYSEPVNTSVVAASRLGTGDMIPGTRYSYTFVGSCSQGGTQQPGAPIISCYYGTGTEVMPGVYSTGLAGVGIRLRNSRGQPMQNAAGITCDTRGASLGTLNADMTYNFTVTIELVKTGDIAGGVLNQSQTYFGFGVYQGNGLTGTNTASTAIGGTRNAIGFSGSLSVREIACTLVFPSVVRLPPVSAATLVSGAGAGSTGFTISQSCDSTVNVGLTFDAAPAITVANETNGTLNIRNPGAAGNAAGVVLQLTDTDGHAVPLRSRIDQGQLAAGALASYTYNMQYVGTGGSVIPGSVESAMVFTFDYN